MSDLHEAAQALAALPPQTEDSIAPDSASVAQGGEAVSRLAHNEENAGSSPAPATTEAEAPNPDGLDIRITHEPGCVIVAFDQLIKWVKLSPDQAEELSNYITANAIMARRGKTILSAKNGIVLPLKRKHQVNRK